MHSKETYRDAILSAVRSIVKTKGMNRFTMSEVIEYLTNKDPTYNHSTIRTHIGSRCCVNSQKHHAVVYEDFERIERGVYKLYRQ